MFGIETVLNILLTLTCVPCSCLPAGKRKKRKNEKKVDFRHSDEGTLCLCCVRVHAVLVGVFERALY